LVVSILWMEKQKRPLIGHRRVTEDAMAQHAKQPAALTLTPLVAKIVRASATRRSAVCVSAAALVLAFTPLTALAARTTHRHTTHAHSAVAIQKPVANIAPVPNYDGCSTSGLCSEGPPCYTSNFAPAFGSPNCEQAELAAIDNARAKEGIGPMYLPSNYNSLSGDEQLLVVIDLERVGRGLPPLAGIVASLDSVAQAGTQVSGQPAGTFADPAFRVGASVGAGNAFAYRCHSTGGGSYACDGSGNPGASIAAGGQINVLDADYGWMYDDGYGGANTDCNTPQAAGCWGHRDNILGSYPTHTQFISATWGASPSTVTRRPALPVMGAGSLQPTGSGPRGNWTAIFASVTGTAPAFVYTLQQALAAGAGNAPS
jgi:hypothetical protein